MLMTNITFTNRIGTPIYMSPEVLNKTHYKSPSDIYSFSITMFEVMKWGEAYPTKIFPHEWDIADFICKGKRLQKPSDMRDDIYSLINECWKQEPKERLEITQIISKLSSL